MFLQIFVIFVTLHLSFANRPVVFEKDNSVIANDPVPESLPQHHQSIPSSYPFYKVITSRKSVPRTQVAEAKFNDLPYDLIEIAQTKLGIHHIEEIPSVAQLTELLGTTTRRETLELLRNLTATDSGIDLIKAFIESSDYTDNREEKDPVQIEADTSGPLLPTGLISETNQKNLEVIQKVLTTPKPELGFFQRISSYLNVFDLFPTNNEIPFSPVNNEVQILNPNNHHGSHNHYHPKWRRSLV